MEESTSGLSPCLDSIFCVMRLCEKGVLWGRGVVEYSSTVDRIAVVISSRDVYGKQMLSTHLILSILLNHECICETYCLLFLVVATARSITSRTSGPSRSNCPSTRTLAP